MLCWGLIQEYKAALKLLDGLLREVKKLDDKLLLVELHLLESRIYNAVQNFAKAKVLVNNLQTFFSP